MADPKFLWMAENDLQPPTELTEAAKEFPESLPLQNSALPLNYAYKPGKEDDGVTLQVSTGEAAVLTAAALDWAVPGHLLEKIELRLKALPKEQRRLLIPLTETAQKIASQIGLIAARPVPPTLTEALAEILTERLGVRIDPRLWADKPLPDHLRVRVELVDTDGKVLWAGRELEELQKQLGSQQRQLSQKASRDDNAPWRAARARWEQAPALEWKFGDLPETVNVSEHAGVPVLAYPGLQVRETGVAVRLFATAEEARAASRLGAARLIESQLRYELGWLGKELRELRTLGPLTATLAPQEQMQREALASIVRWLCGREVHPLQAKVFERRLNEAKQDLRGLVPKLTDWLREALTLRLGLQTHKTPYPGLEHDLSALLPADFLGQTPFERIKELPRYLKAMQARADRWKRDQAKDAQRAGEIAPFAAAVTRLGPRASNLRWLVEEFRVSLFAQELGTAEPVSAVRLERALQEASSGGETSKEPAPASAKLAVPLPVKGKIVFKSFDALGNLPR